MRRNFSWVLVALGVWLISVSITFGGWKTLNGVSDLFSGGLLVFFGSFKGPSTRRAVRLIGLWLQLAPLIFWVPDAWNYINDTGVGVIAIIFSFLIKKNKEEEKEEIPSGWSYNPSSWSHRIPVTFLAILCWCFSRYMAAFQLGYLTEVWDPFFEKGTFQVITSSISKSFPISDAGLGAVCYTLEAILAWQGGINRWATMPWLVLSFAFLVIPVGFVSIGLIILQPIVVGAWCSWCLATALGMLAMIILMSGEFVAVIQSLIESKRKGFSIAKCLSEGIPLSIRKKGVVRAEFGVKKGMGWGRGISFPLNLVGTLVLGIWLIVTPSLLLTEHFLAQWQFILGPWIVFFSAVGFAEVFRVARIVNIGLGGLLFLASLFSVETSYIMKSHVMLISVLVIGLSWQKGKVTSSYGSWNRWIF